MADSKITALTAISTVDPTADPLVIVDVSDTSMAASGTTKKSTINQLLGSGGTATLASATITGAATVGTTLGVTGVSTFAAGTALLPALTTTGDTNTGIYYPAADTFAVTTGGTERLRVDSTGLGVGVSPSYNIHARGATDGRIQVEGASGFGMVFVQASSGNAAQLQLNSSGGSGRRFALASNSTGQFSIADETASLSRLVIDSSGNVTVSTGNLVMGTANKGIDFSINSDASATSELLNDYEEGTWTGTVTGGTFTNLTTGRYTKIGRQVFASITPNTTAITGNLVISGLPFTAGARSAMVVATAPPAGVTYIPRFVDTTDIYVNVSGTYAGVSESTYFAFTYDV